MCNGLLTSPARPRTAGLALLLALIWLVVPLRDAASETLSDALKLTYERNPDLEAARARLRAVVEQVPQALAGFRPQFFVDGLAESVRGQSKLADSDRDTYGATARVLQNLYAGGGTTAAVARAEANVRAERARLYVTEQEVLLQAVAAYTAVVRDREVLRIAINNAERLKQHLAATKDRFEVGEVARTDVAQAQARYARGLADVESARADLASSVTEYRRVVGQEPGELTTVPALESLPESLEEAYALADKHPSIEAARYQLTAARQAVLEARAGLLPSVDLEGRLSYTEEPTALVDWQREARLGVSVSIPLYQGGAVYARVREARQTVTRFQRELDSAVRRVQKQVGEAWERLMAAAELIRAFEAQVKANRIALEGVQEENLVGTRTVLDVLDAEQELFDSRTGLVRATQAHVLASYQLKSAIGQLTAVDLGLEVEVYEPDRYYERNRARLFGLE